MKLLHNFRNLNLNPPIHRFSKRILNEGFLGTLSSRRKYMRSSKINRSLSFLEGDDVENINNFYVPGSSKLFRTPVVRLISSAYEHIDTGFITGSLAYYYYITHVEETPITGRKRFLIFSRKKAEKESQENFEKIMEEYTGSIVHPENPQYQRVMKLANRILDANKDLPEIQTKNWTVTLLDSPIQHAFSLPNGNIFVYTGLLEFSPSDDELAITLSHEIAHSLLGHDRERRSINRLFLAVKLLAIGTLYAFSPRFNLIAFISQGFIACMGLVGFDEVMFHYPPRRKQESEADKVGLQLAAKACFDVRSAIAYWHKKALLDAMNQSQDEWRSTHPSYTTRQIELEKQLPSALRIREYCDYPKLSSTDPRQMMKAFEEAVTKGKTLQIDNETIEQ